MTAISRKYGFCHTCITKDKKYEICLIHKTSNVVIFVYSFVSLSHEPKVNVFPIQKLHSLLGER